MKINEITEGIARLSKGDYTGGKDSLYDKTTGKVVKKLPGGSGFTYSVVKAVGRRGDEGVEVKIFDPNSPESTTPPKQQKYEFNREYQARLKQWQQMQDSGQNPGQLIAKLALHTPWGGFPLKGALQVGTITVDEGYRGRGLAKALYGIVLTIMKRPLIAGDSQTPGGRMNWVSLSQIPGVQMKGYMSFDSEYFDTTQSEFGGEVYAKQSNKQMSNTIDVIMGKLGGQYIGQVGRHGDHYFAFDVRPNTTGKELESYVTQNLAKVYGNDWESPTQESGLYAVWTGQAESIEEEVIDEASMSPEVKKHMVKQGYKFLGHGQDQDAYLAPDGSILKIFGYERDSRGFSFSQRSFIDFANFCRAHPNNPFLPQFGGWEPFVLNGQQYLQIKCERLFDLGKSKMGAMADMLEELVTSVERYGAERGFNAFMDNAYGKYNSQYEEKGASHLIMLLGGEQQAMLFCKTIEQLAKLAQQKRYRLDLHAGNFMLGSDGEIVINDPFFTGAWR